MKAISPEDREQWLADRLVVEFPGDSTLMSVGMADDANDDAAKIVDEVVHGLLTGVVDKERQNRLNRYDVLEKTTERYKNELLDKQRQLYVLKQENGESATSQTMILNGEMAGLENSIGQARDRMTAAEFAIAHAKARMEPLPAGSVGRSAEKAAVDLAKFDVKFWKRQNHIACFLRCQDGHEDRQSRKIQRRRGGHRV